MAIDVTEIKGFIEQNVQETKLGVYESAAMINYTTKVVGVKGAKKINELVVTAAFADGSGCGAYGDSEGDFVQHDIVSDVIGSQIAFCESDLHDTYMSSTLTKGELGQESSLMREWLNGELLKSTGQELGKLAWQGDKVGGSGNLSKADGFIIRLDTGGVAVSTPIAWTVDNAYDELFRIYSAYTGSSDLYIFLDSYKYKLAVASIGNKFANNSAFAPQIIDGQFTENKRSQTPLPLSMGCYIVHDAGLNGTGATTPEGSVYAFAKENVVVAEDLKADTDTTKIFKDEKDEMLYIRLKFLFGIYIFKPSEVVKYVY
jgi:hypothetical protein